MPLTDDQLRGILQDIRTLAGTNPAMATGELTGRRGGRGGGAPVPPAGGPTGFGGGPGRGRGARSTTGRSP